MIRCVVFGPKFLYACMLMQVFRSGNWLVRNSCLKVLTELFFAYSRDKYEVLAQVHLPIVTPTPKKSWKTSKRASYKGRPYHSLALDEAQECIVNRKLKQ